MKYALKTVALTSIFLLVVFINILSDYISFSFSTAIFTDAAYWLNVAILNTGLIIVIMVCRSYAKDKEIGSNKEYADTQKEIDGAYVEFNKRKLYTEFNKYIGEINFNNKLERYEIKLNRKLIKAKKEVAMENISIPKKREKKNPSRICSEPASGGNVGAFPSAVNLLPGRERGCGVVLTERGVQ